MRNLLYRDSRAGGLLAVPAFAADYTIMAPAAPGGGWDQTARSHAGGAAGGPASPATCR